MDFLDYEKIFQRKPDADEKNRVYKQEIKQNEIVKREEQQKGSARGCRGQLYKVEKGDTLYSISRKYEIRVRDLMQANPFVDMYQLKIGEELCIPVPPGSELPPDTRSYVVKKQDTVLSILKQNQISYEELAKWNKSAAVLSFPAGTVLLIPKGKRE